MEGNTQGRRLAPGSGGKGKIIALAVVAVLLLALLGGYIGVCAYAYSDVLLPGTVIAGNDMGGMRFDEAAQLLNAQGHRLYDDLEIPLAVGEVIVPISGRLAQVGLDVDGSLAAAQAAKGNFITAGARYLSALMGDAVQVPCPVVISAPEYIADTVRDAERLLIRPVTQSHWRVEEDADSATLIITKGIAGASVGDTSHVLEQIAVAFSTSDTTPIPILPKVNEPRALDLEAIADQVNQEPVNATVDPSNDEIIPHKLGRSLDVKEARRRYAQTANGKICAISLDVTQPEVTTLDLRSSLYRDILGEGVSKITGDANRVNNVILAAKACDGVVLLPGEQMSYNKTTGQRTVEKGYREASGYTARGIEDMVGGGVCQPSSTLYLACLNANLEIVNRKNHMYTVSYMPDGMDATVSWPNLDYVFANNTPYPIKISSKVEKRVLTMRIYGTKTDDHYVKMESKVLEVRPAETRYQADSNIPRGTTKILQPAHNGKTVEVYQNIYDGQNNLLSRTLISTDTYRTGNKVVAYNPADGVPGVIAPTAPETPPAEEPVTPETPPAEEPTNPETPSTPEPTVPEQTTPSAPEPPPAQEPTNQETPPTQEPTNQETPPSSPEGLPVE